MLPAFFSKTSAFTVAFFTASSASFSSFSAASFSAVPFLRLASFFLALATSVSLSATSASAFAANLLASSLASAASPPAASSMAFSASSFAAWTVSFSTFFLASSAACFACNCAISASFQSRAFSAASVAATATSSTDFSSGAALDPSTGGSSAVVVVTSSACFEIGAMETTSSVASSHLRVSVPNNSFAKASPDSNRLTAPWRMLTVRFKAFLAIAGSWDNFSSISSLGGSSGIAAVSVPKTISASFFPLDSFATAAVIISPSSFRRCCISEGSMSLLILLTAGASLPGPLSESFGPSVVVAAKGSSTGGEVAVKGSSSFATSGSCVTKSCSKVSI
mmetsp:Transcript_35901/g.77547  ORF Transcript_35901/g.77547 Transcript_35901/m.77547 type:complete len:337 (+) Transcript_35901:596-1606(+)